MIEDRTEVLSGCSLERLQPLGVLIRREATRSLAELPHAVLHDLLLRERLLVFRNFTPFDNKGSLSDYARSWGPLLEWEFGTVFEVVEQANPKNYLFTSGSVPYHWDGAFAKQVPWLQVFQCQESAGSGQGGETLFCDTARVWDAATSDKHEQWQSVEIEYVTEKVAHYGGTIRAPLVGRHPLTGANTLRFAEPANAATVRLNTPELQVHGISGTDVPAFLDDLLKRLYAPEFVYAHSWESGDLVIADNHVLLHGRSPYRSQLPRKLWRVHVL